MQLIPVECQNCGAQLHIDPASDQIRCPFCGTTYAIRRDGSTIALRGLTESLGKIGHSTEATALELAIVRLGREIEELEKEKKANQTPDSVYGWLLGCIVVTILGIMVEAQKEPICCGITVFAAIIGTLLSIGLWVTHQENKEFDQRIQERRQKVERRKARLDGN